MTQVEEAKVLMTKLIAKVESLKNEKSELQEKYDRITEEHKRLEGTLNKQNEIIKDLRSKVLPDSLEGELKEIITKANEALEG